MRTIQERLIDASEDIARLRVVTLPDKKEVHDRLDEIERQIENLWKGL